MILYILPIVIIILYYILNKTKLYKYNSNNILFCCIVFTIFTVLQGFRAYDIGTDTNNYVHIYNVIKNASWIDIITRKAVDVEIGYGILMKIIAMLNMPERYFLIIIAGIINAGFMYFVYKNSKNPLLSVLIFMGAEFFILSFTALRQMIAVIIILYAYMFIEKKENLKAFFTIIFASLFHVTALIFLPVILFRYVKINRKILICIVLIFFVVQLCGMPVLQAIIGQTIYSRYLPSNGASGGETQLLVILVYTAIGIVLYYKNGKVGTNNILILLMIMAIFIQGFACRIQLMGRLIWYFYIFNVIYLPNLIVSIKEDKVRNGMYILIAGLNIAQYLLFSIKLYNIEPYKFIK